MAFILYKRNLFSILGKIIFYSSQKKQRKMGISGYVFSVKTNGVEVSINIPVKFYSDKDSDNHTRMQGV